jgi:hypothetical protein
MRYSAPYARPCLGIFHPFYSNNPYIIVDVSVLTVLSCGVSRKRPSPPPKNLPRDISRSAQNSSSKSFIFRTVQKSAQLIESHHFQVPAFSHSCALFFCIPFSFNNFPKTYRGVYHPLASRLNEPTVNKAAKSHTIIKFSPKSSLPRAGRQPAGMMGNHE